MDNCETYLTRRKINPVKEDNEKKNRKDSIKKVSLILNKCESLRSVEEKLVLESFSEVTKQIKKRKERIQLYKDRVVEKEDSFEVIKKKSDKLAEIISKAKHLVCYTGAGISTSAKIPDYRGSNGIWTMLQQGKEIEKHDLSLADPTYTHMALYELQRRNILRYIVSQNCDGLHLRAGLPRNCLSEVHGNMYIEVCKYCKPNLEYWRLFDTTESTARFNHKTNRRCYVCNKPLVDSIVHFGERGSLKWPLNWEGACKHSEKADVILCLGSSLKVLKKYSWIWQMDRPKNKRAKICIINLQWTSKDKVASLKINGKCDDIMKLIMKHLNINTPIYSRLRDPIFFHASDLCYEELHTVSQPMLKIGNYKLSSANALQKPSGEIRHNKKPLLIIPKNKKPCVKTNLCLRQNTETETNSIDSDNISEVSSVSNTKLELNLKQNTEENIIDLKKKFINSNIEYSNPKESSFNDKNINCASIWNSIYDENKTTNSFNENATACKIELGEKNIDREQNHKNFAQLIKPCDIYLGYMHPNFSDIHHPSVLIKHLQSFTKTNSSDTDKGIEKETKINKLDEESQKCFMTVYDLSQKIDRLPNWYEVRYAYSGLHSIIKPPPPEINMWSSNVVPIYKMNRKKADCQFCFDNYAEMTCQFYRNISAVFVIKTLRRGRVIVCECCDYSDCEDTNAKEDAKCDTNDSEQFTDKRAKLDVEVFNQPAKEIQAGWFGKGYRKTQKKKKR